MSLKKYYGYLWIQIASEKVIWVWGQVPSDILDQCDI